MADNTQPYADIAERLLWHRELMGLNQADYAARISTKRSTYSLWFLQWNLLALAAGLVFLVWSICFASIESY